jgi:hypothetical protein
MHRQHLLWSLQMLAAPAQVQVALQPDHVAKADELALEFDHWYECARGSISGEWTPEQSTALSTIDASLARMSAGGPAFSAELWSVSALHTASKWEEVRGLARNALRCLGWPLEDPPATTARGQEFVAGTE